MTAIRDESPISNSKTFDVDLELQDVQAAITSSGDASVGGSGQVLDIGLGQYEAEIIFDVTAIDVADGDEQYDLSLLGSNDAFASRFVTLATLKLGADVANVRDLDSTIGRYRLPFVNIKDDEHFDSVKIRNTVSGTSPSITYSAFIGMSG